MPALKFPRAYSFQAEYLEPYQHGMEMPKHNFNVSKVVIPEKQRPLARFLAYYFRILSLKGNLIMDAYREKSGQILVRDGIISPEVPADFQGSIDALAVYRNEIAKTREHALERGLPENMYPVNCLQGIIDEVDRDLLELRKPASPSSILKF